MAIALGNEGSKVVLVDINPHEGEGAVREMEALGAEAIFVRADVSKKAEVQTMVEASLERFDAIDILVNNAGVHDAAPFVEETEELWQRMFQVNVMGTVLFDYWSNGDVSLVAAVAIIMGGVTTLGVALALAVGGTESFGSL